MKDETTILNLNDHQRFRPVGGGHGGEPPYNGDMERRVSKLEDKIDNVQSALFDIRVALTEIKANMATRDDVESLKVEIDERPTRTGLWGVVVTSVGLAAAVVTLIMNFGHIFHS